MSDSTANFSLTSDYNSTFDITWSFQYSVTGSNTSNGGFCTFLFNNTALTSGGALTGLGYMPLSGNGGVSGAVLGVCFTSDNLIKIKKGTTFETLTTFTIFDSLSPFVKTYENYNTIRFNLTDVSQTLKISLKDKATDEYVEIKSINTGLSSDDKTYYKVGFSYATPLTSGNDKITIKLKDFHVHGQAKVPTVTYMDKPYSLPKADTYYIIQSPTSATVDIAEPDFVGSLIYNPKK